MCLLEYIFYMVDLAGKIIATRKKMGLNQSDFARLIGISMRGLQTYERREREPRSSVLKKIAEAGSVTVDWLLSEEEEPTHKLKTEKWMAAEPPGPEYGGDEWRRAQAIPDLQELCNILVYLPEDKRKMLLDSFLPFARNVAIEEQKR